MNQESADKPHDEPFNVIKMMDQTSGDDGQSTEQIVQLPSPDSQPNAPGTQSQVNFTKISMTSELRANEVAISQTSNNVIPSVHEVDSTMQMPQQPTPDQPQTHVQSHQPSIRPLLDHEPAATSVLIMDGQKQGVSQDSVSLSPQKTAITKVTLNDELNVFYWTKTKEIIGQIAEKAKNSVDSVITTLDPGMKEYLYSGGDVNIIVMTDSECLISPIRDSFQSAFGRATVNPAPSNPSGAFNHYPIRLACGFQEAKIVAQEKIKKLKQDTGSVPQNQVVVVVQPTLFQLGNNMNGAMETSIGSTEPPWFSAYCMFIVDPVLNVTMNCFSHSIPIDAEIVESLKKSDGAINLPEKHLGFTASLDEIMSYRLKIDPMNGFGDEYGCYWLREWAGVYETQLIHQVSSTLANSYRRKRNECSVIETTP